MKEAVAFIIDASQSMDQAYPAGEQTDGGLWTRLGAAKSAVQSMIADLMMQSTQNEVSVIICKTDESQHHLIPPGTDMEEEDPNDCEFPNLTELTDGVTKPSISLLRQVGAVASSSTPTEELRGDVCDAIVVAADAIYKRTTNAKGQFLKFARRIVVFTDAEHDFLIDAPLYLQLLDSVRDMDCHIQVIGLGFDSDFEGFFPEKAAAPSPNKKVKVEEGAEDVKEEAAEDVEEDGDANMISLKTAKERQRFLQDMTEKTGGQVVAASSLQQVLEVNKGKRLTSSTRSKMELRIAPGLCLEAKFMLSMKEEGYPRIEKEVVLIDDSTGKPLLNDDGTEKTETPQTVYHYVDEENLEDTVDDIDKTTAIRYGSDLVPLGETDLDGLKSPPPSLPWLQVLGYILLEKVPLIYMSGPPYVISGGESQKSCAAISALAKAMFRMKKIAVCTFLKSRRSAGPILGALLPLEEEKDQEPIRLVFLQLPFAGEVKHLTLAGCEEMLADESQDQKVSRAQTCDDMIDSLTLTGVNFNGTVPSPFLRSWNQSKIQRAIDPSAPLVKIREEQKTDPMVTPPELLSQARPVLSRFSGCFPLEVAKSVKAKKKGTKGRVAPNYQDFLQE